jgi:rod shape-determining protein MreD
MAVTNYGDLLTNRRRGKASRYRPIVLILVPMASILFQVYVPLFFEYLAYLELPLLVTIYFALMGRRPVGALLYGSAIGLLQDALSQNPLGMFGIVKTLVGYFAATLSLRFDVDNSVARFLVGFFFYCFHEIFYWMLGRALLGSPLELSMGQTLMLGVLNGVVAVPLFGLLDKLKEPS